MTKFNYRVFLFICGILGISLQIVNYGWAMLWYYTILSNLLVTIFLAYTIYKSKKSSHFETTKYFRVKGGISLAISITFFVYHFLLAPLVTKEAYWNKEADLSILEDKNAKTIMNSMRDHLNIQILNYALATIKDEDKEKAEKLKENFIKYMKSGVYPAELEIGLELMEVIDKSVANREEPSIFKY